MDITQEIKDFWKKRGLRSGLGETPTSEVCYGNNKKNLEKKAELEGPGTKWWSRSQRRNRIQEGETHPKNIIEDQRLKKHSGFGSWGSPLTFQLLWGK